MKKYLIIIIFTLLFITNVTATSPTAAQNNSVFQVGSDKYITNNLENSMDTITFMENKRIYVPIRYLAHACGIKDEDIRWDDQTKTVTLTGKGNNLSIQVGSYELNGNGEILPIDTPPVMVGSRAFLPARPIAEFFGCTVEWDAASNSVLVYPPGGLRPTTPEPANIILVNKASKLQPGYQPGPLVDFEGFIISSGILEPLNNLLDIARKQGIALTITSGYRSYNEQQALYNSRLKTAGQKLAASTVAPPGHSEHQTGLAVDLAGDSKAYSWLEGNCWRYGFIQRYPWGKQGITGYSYEPWHYRYVGVPIAEFMRHKNIQTLEEFVHYIRAN